MIKNLTIILPKILPIVRDQKNQDIKNNAAEYNLYFSNMIVPYSSEYDIQIGCEYGKNYGDRWCINEFPDEVTEFPLEVLVYGQYGELLAKKECKVEIYEKSFTEPPFSLLCIGDSMTHNGIYVTHMATKLYNIKTKGIRTFNGLIYYEGRGGWKLSDYFTRYADHWGISPFLFPEGVANYFGDISFFEMLKDTANHTYSYTGFPMEEPEVGQIYYRDGKLYQKGETDDTLYEEHPKFEFDFEKYIKRYQIGKVDAVSVLSGCNELQYTPYIEGEEIINSIISYMKQLMTSVWEYDSSIKIIINLPVLGADSYAWGSKLNCWSSVKQYNYHIQCLGQAILEEFEGMEHVFISPMLLTIDPVYGFSTQAAAANLYHPQLVTHHSNWVHPNEFGYKQMGDALAGVVQKIRIAKRQ